MRIHRMVGPSLQEASCPRSLPPSAGQSSVSAARLLDQFLSRGRDTVIISGAGISVDSDIPDYRGSSLKQDGVLSNKDLRGHTV